MRASWCLDRTVLTVQLTANRHPSRHQREDPNGPSLPRAAASGRGCADTKAVMRQQPWVSYRASQNARPQTLEVWEEPFEDSADDRIEGSSA